MDRAAGLAQQSGSSTRPRWGVSAALQPGRARQLQRSSAWDRSRLSGVARGERRAALLVGWLAVFCLARGAADARAQEPGAWAQGDTTDPADSAAPEQPREPSDSRDPRAESPRVRIELWARGGPPLEGKVKLGREAQARSWSFREDARIPPRPSYGFAADLDLEVFDWASVGVSAWEVRTSSARRRIHAEGLAVDGRAFGGGERLTTRIELRYAELSLRYLWRNERRVRLWFGIGAAWLSTRIRVEAADRGATTRWAEVFAPSLTYALEARFAERWQVFLLSGIAAAPHRFPSLTTRFRLGLGYELWPGVWARSALSVRSALLGNLSELTSQSVPAGHAWRRLRWLSLGLEAGIAVSL